MLKSKFFPSSPRRPQGEPVFAHYPRHWEIRGYQPTGELSGRAAGRTWPMRAQKLGPPVKELA